MSSIEKNIERFYGEKLRVRVCGILINKNKILLINHSHLTESNCFWAPPGGGMEFGENAEDCLKREFLEETGLKITINKFLFVYEYLSPPIHAIELFFEVSSDSNLIETGSDPEFSAEHQIIKKTAFLEIDMLKNEPKENLHRVLHENDNEFKIFKQKGYFKSQ
jgi:8-oxo-dGTP diphosphatase